MRQFTTEPVIIDEKAIAEVWQEINELTGLTSFKEWLVTAERSIRYNLASATGQGDVADQTLFPSRVVFSGPPGCGKTTAAGLAAKMFHALGVIGGNVVGPVSVSELKLLYLSHSSENIRKVLETAKNGTLIIEESPIFDDNDHVRIEALHSFLHELKAEEYAGTFIVFSELNEQIDAFREEHPACGILLGRVEFYSFTPVECSTMFERFLAKKGWIISEEVFQHVQELAHYEQLKKGELFANAFWVQRLARSVIEGAQQRSSLEGTPQNIITIKDLEKCTTI